MQGEERLAEFKALNLRWLALKTMQMFALWPQAHRDAWTETSGTPGASWTSTGPSRCR